MNDDWDCAACIDSFRNFGGCVATFGRDSYIVQSIHGTICLSSLPYRVHSDTIDKSVSRCSVNDCHGVDKLRSPDVLDLYGTRDTSMSRTLSAFIMASRPR